MISVSFIKSIFDKDETINKIDESIADYIHVDLMDGEYVTNKNFEIDEIIQKLQNKNKLLDIHLMTKNPLYYIKELVKLQPKIITFHLDACDNQKEVIKFLKDNDILVGVAVNPDEDINLLNEYFDLIDYVLVMSVVPGLGGQEFMASAVDKIKYLQDKNKLIGIDGGINDKSIKYLENLRVDIIVSGSFICMSNDYDEQIKKLEI